MDDNSKRDRPKIKQHTSGGGHQLIDLTPNKIKEKINYKAGALAICKLAGEKVRAEHSNKMRRVRDNKNG